MVGRTILGMPDHTRSRGGPRRRAAEIEPELDTLCRRLVRLGATPDEVTSVRDNWEAFDEHWTPADQRHMANAPDSVLLAELRDVRAEWALVQAAL